MKKILALCLCMISLGLMGCSPIVSDNAGSGDYATQNRVSAIEYSIFMNKQVTVFTTQLTSHLSLIASSGTNYENLITVTEESIAVMEAALDEVIVTYPPISYEDDRETTITVMKTTIEHMKSYLQDMKEEKGTGGYIDIFQSDYFALTAQASLYYQ